MVVEACTAPAILDSSFTVKLLQKQTQNGLHMCFGLYNADDDGTYHNID